MNKSILSDEQVQMALARLNVPNDVWSIDQGKLHAQFKFADFKSAFAFMTHCALFAEQHNHHPEWFNVYNRVEVWLTTHEAGGMTQLDVDFARAMSDIFSSE